MRVNPASIYILDREAVDEGIGGIMKKRVFCCGDCPNTHCCLEIVSDSSEAPRRCPCGYSTFEWKEITTIKEEL